MSDPYRLEDQVIAALRRITRAIDLHSRLLLQKHGLTSPQLAALRAILRLQPLSVGTLAQALHLSQATVTGILGRLESRKLVTRSRGDHDRRSVLVELTESGFQLATEAPSLLHERFQVELEKLQEWEQSMILATLQRIASMMDTEEIEAPPVLGTDAAAAKEEDVPAYLENAVVAIGEAPLADDQPVTMAPPLPQEPIGETRRAASMTPCDRKGDT